MDLDTLLKGKPPESFSAHELGGEAYWRLYRDQDRAARRLLTACSGAPAPEPISETQAHRRHLP